MTDKDVSQHMSQHCHLPFLQHGYNGLRDIDVQTALEKTPVVHVPDTSPMACAVIKGEVYVSNGLRLSLDTTCLQDLSFNSAVLNHHVLDGLRVFAYISAPVVSDIKP